MRIEQKLCKAKIFHLQSISNAIKCINQRFAFKYSHILCLALIFNLKIQVLQVLQSCTQKNYLLIYLFFPVIDTNQWLSG